VGVVRRASRLLCQVEPQTRRGKFCPVPSMNWQNTHAAYVKLGTLKGTEAATDSYTEQFLAACNDFDRAAVVAQAKSMNQ